MCTCEYVCGAHVCMSATYGDGGDDGARLGNWERDVVELLLQTGSP